jgi:hypothetical protein
MILRKDVIMNNKKKCKTEWEQYDLDEYPIVENVEFPKEIYIAYCVCGKSCGDNGFIVDGSSQVCQHCGKLNFRTEVKKYILSER